MTQIPNTNTVVSYAYTIKSQGGVPIGTLQGFTPSANRALDRVRQIMNEVDDTKEIVPGRTDFSITIDRLETYEESMMEAFGFDGITDISQIVDGFIIQEVISGPISKGSKKRTIVYDGCWIQNISKTVREGTITVSESVTLQVTRIIPSPLR